MSVVLDLKVLPPGVIGAEVRGIDLAHVTNTEIDAIKNAWYRHDVLLFRNQQLTDDDLLSFSRHFGTLDSPPNQGAGRKSPPGYPEVYIVSNVLGEQGEPIGALGDGEAAWHTDMSYAAQPTYRSGGPAMQDLVAGHIDLLVIQAAAAMPQVRAGTIKALANLSASRSPVVPGIPTADESGVPGLYVTGWFGFFAPRGTPKEIIARLNAAMVQALADPALRARFSDLGLDVASREQQAPEGLAAFHKAEIEKWWPIIKAAGIRAE